jgi:hypothetical protein
MRLVQQSRTDLAKSQDRSGDLATYCSMPMRASCPSMCMSVMYVSVSLCVCVSVCNRVCLCVSVCVSLRGREQNCV